ncbi:MAG: response regulator [Planctomycetes bacterium]|nr:response regulator [Planctomycetota bacterium]
MREGFVHLRRGPELLEVEERSSQGLNIMVVDDDVRCLDAIQELLALDGHWTCAATRGMDALRLAERLRVENRPLELSILDVDVPDMTGLETFVRLSSLQPGIGGIFITGDSSRSLEGTVKAIGGFALVRKPLEVSLVRKTVTDFRIQLRFAG